MTSHVLLLVAALLATTCLGCESSRERAEAKAGEGLALARTGDLERATAAFREALAEDPSNSKARYNLGVALLAERRAGDAVATFETFVSSRPEDDLGHFQLARAYLAAGRPGEALAALRNAVALGFADHEAFALHELEPLRSDLRFVQLEAVVAQRAGVRPRPVVEFAGRDGLGYGNERLQPAPLPGTDINRALQCAGQPERRPGDAGACEPDPTAP